VLGVCWDDMELYHFYKVFAGLSDNTIEEEKLCVGGKYRII